MRKIESLREALVAAYPKLGDNPERLTVFVERGSCAARMGAQERDGINGFEYRYTAEAILLDFEGNANAVFIAVLNWLRENQPELLLRQDPEAFAFDADILDDRRTDVQIRIELTDAVDIVGGEPVFRDEPSPYSRFEGFANDPALQRILAGEDQLAP